MNSFLQPIEVRIIQDQRRNRSLSFVAATNESIFLFKKRSVSWCQTLLFRDFTGNEFICLFFFIICSDHIFFRLVFQSFVPLPFIRYVLTVYRVPRSGEKKTDRECEVRKQRIKEGHHLSLFLFSFIFLFLQKTSDASTDFMWQQQRHDMILFSLPCPFLLDVIVEKNLPRKIFWVCNRDCGLSIGCGEPLLLNFWYRILSVTASVSFNVWPVFT